MTALEIPAGVTHNGRSELMPGRVLLHYTDETTGSDFTVSEKGATTAKVAETQQKHREAFGVAAATFAVPFYHLTHF